MGLRTVIGIFFFAVAQFLGIYPMYMFIVQFDRQAAVWQTGIVLIVFICGVVSAAFWKYNKTQSIDSMGEIEKAVYAAQIIQSLKDDHGRSGTDLLNEITATRNPTVIAGRIKERGKEE